MDGLLSRLPGARSLQRWRWLIVALVSGAAAYSMLHWLGRTSGSSRRERSRLLPGDLVVAHPSLVTNHAVTIDAPPSSVWPWLVQMGWHRGGWYTSRWVDILLFPANSPSAELIVPELQDLAVGDFIPDGPPDTGCGFVVEVLEDGHYLVLRSTTHLPPGWRDRFGASINWTWTFALEAVGVGQSRLLFRSRARLAPRWVADLYRFLIVPADYVMARQMLAGIRRRAEQAPPPNPGTTTEMLRSADHAGSRAL